MNNIPDILFDLLQEKTFKALTLEQQELVLTYVSAADFDDMHHAYLFEQETFKMKMPKIISHKEKLWDELNTKPKLNWWRSKLPWQIASSILLPLCLFFALNKKTSPTTIPIVQVIHDTINIHTPEKIASTNSQAIKSIDTVIKWKERIVGKPIYVYNKNNNISSAPIANKSISNANSISSTATNYSSDAYIIEDDIVSNTRNLNVMEKISIQNLNIKNDSLAQTVGFNFAEKGNVGFGYEF